MPYESYRSLIAKAKWSLTFGEGLDGYFTEMAWTGGVPFAVYNDRFFMPQFRGLATVYDTWEELQTWIVGDILKLDHEEEYDAASEQIRQALNELYSCEKYRENIRLFYNEEYNFPAPSPAKSRPVDEMLTRIREDIARLKEKEEARDASIARLREGINARDASIAQLREDTKTLGPLREGIEARDASIAQLRQNIEARDASIAQLRQNIEVQDANLAQLRECIKARDASIEDFRQSTSWKLTAPLRLTMYLIRLGITAAETALSELSTLRK
jgi:DNA repair exonuclease SbcCD ATPase subunit